MIVDMQALTAHYENPPMLGSHVREIALDYLSLGVDPEVSSIFYPVHGTGNCRIGCVLPNICYGFKSSA
jgi:tryptophanyl-tRNA synthetase